MPVARCMSRWAFTPPTKCVGLYRGPRKWLGNGNGSPSPPSLAAYGCCCQALPESASSALAPQQTGFQFRVRRRRPQPDGDQGAGEILTLDHTLLGSVDGDLYPRMR